jgi:hypothetical protein
VYYAWRQTGSPGTSNEEKLRLTVEQVKRLPWVVVVGTAINVSLMGGLNSWWTFLMLKNLRKKSKKE